MISLDGFVRKKTVIKIGTKNFTFAELNLAELAEFKAELVKKRDELNDERRSRLIELAEKIGSIDPIEVLKLTDSSVSEEEFEAQMETVEGLGHLAYLSLRVVHPGIDRNQAKELVTPANIDKVVAAMFPKPDKRPESSALSKKKRKSPMRPE